MHSAASKYLRGNWKDCKLAPHLNYPHDKLENYQFHVESVLDRAAKALNVCCERRDAGAALRRHARNLTAARTRIALARAEIIAACLLNDAEVLRHVMDEHMIDADGKSCVLLATQVATAAGGNAHDATAVDVEFPGGARAPSSPLTTTTTTSSAKNVLAITKSTFSTSATTTTTTSSSRALTASSSTPLRSAAGGGSNTVSGHNSQHQQQQQQQQQLAHLSSSPSSSSQWLTTAPQSNNAIAKRRFEGGSMGSSVDECDECDATGRQRRQRRRRRRRRQITDAADNDTAAGAQLHIIDAIEGMEVDERDVDATGNNGHENDDDDVDEDEDDGDEDEFDAIPLLCVAAAANAVDVAALLVARGASLDATADAKHGEGLSALHIALYNLNPQLVALLVANGANVNAPCSSRADTAARRALATPDALAHVATLDSCGSGGSGSTNGGRHAHMGDLREHHPHDTLHMSHYVYDTGERRLRNAANQMLPRHCAYYERSVPCLCSLAPLHVLYRVAAHKNSPLAPAALVERAAQCARVLRDAGAAFDAPAATGGMRALNVLNDLPLHMCLSVRNRELWRTLIDSGLDFEVTLADRTNLMQFWCGADFRGVLPSDELEQLQELLGYVLAHHRSKVNINHVNQENFTLLAHACRWRQLTPIVHLLLRHGADVSIRNRAGDTPLCVAIFYECYESIKLLLQFDADVNDINDRGLSPLYYCWQRCNRSLDTLWLLLSVGNANPFAEHAVLAASRAQPAIAAARVEAATFAVRPLLATCRQLLRFNRCCWLAAQCGARSAIVIRTIAAQMHALLDAQARRRRRAAHGAAADAAFVGEGYSVASGGDGGGSRQALINQRAQDADEWPLRAEYERRVATRCATVRAKQAAWIAQTRGAFLAEILTIGLQSSDDLWQAK